jgi:hypothetical protein
MLYNTTTMNKVVTIQKYIDKSLSIEDAMKHLQCSERTIYRYARIYKEHGPPWLRHWLSWRRSNNRNKKRDRLEKYARQERFRWFWPTLLAEKIEEILWYPVPVESLRRRMIERWVRMPRKPRKVKRTPRKRKQWYGMMIQFDWSYHDWLENGKERCLLLWVDDATWKCMHVKFTKNESIDDVISYREEYFEIYGKPSIIYLDRHASYKVNHRKDQFDHTTITRFETAMRYLWIHVIFARSAEWKWRVENKFKLFQDRWIKELRLAWIDTYDEAERYLQEVVVPSLNKKFGIESEVKWDYHVKLTGKDKQQLERYFAKRTKRKISKVWVVRYQWGKYLVKKWQTLNWTRDVYVLESHLWNLQMWNWDLQLCFEKKVR